MRILITGATGFVGGHLLNWLSRDGPHDLHGLSRLGRESPIPDKLSSLAQWHAVDLEQPADLDRVLRTTRPEWIFHLAGYSNAGKSFHEPAAAWAGNWQATFNLYEAVARLDWRPRILFTSTGLVYGHRSGAESSFSEEDSLHPASPYASSKSAADLLSYQVTCHPGLDIVRVRCFNQIGPGQTADYATANFARQIAAIERGQQQSIIETGDLSGQRDLTDVRDIVRAFLLLMQKGQTGEVYNAGSGVVRTMQSILDRMRSISGTKIEVRQKIDPSRRSDTSVSRANIGKLQQATGWRPEISLDQSLRDLLDYWRMKAADV